MKLNTRNVLSVFGFILAFSLNSFGQSNVVVDTNMWQPNGIVNTVFRMGNNIYLGGEFTHIGPRTGSWVGVDSTTGALNGSALRINGTVFASVSDGAGGWFIGGSFNSVAGVTRNCLAHILANNTLDLTWNPNVSHAVRALALSGNTLFIGGQFIQVGGQIRHRLAAVNALTGQVNSLNLTVPGTIHAMAVDGNTLYIGGEFTSVAGQTRNRIAAINISTGQRTSWNPNANGTVRAIAVNGDNVYIGGDFLNVRGEDRQGIAAIEASTGQPTSWAPQADGAVKALSAVGDFIYAGGSFENIGGQLRRAIAVLDAVTGEATNWDAMVGSYFGDYNDVYTIGLSGNTIYIGGNVSSVGTQTRKQVAALDINTALLKSWSPSVNNLVRTIAFSGNTVFLGGEFNSVGGENRNRLAAFDATTGQLTSWNPDAVNTVKTIVGSGNIIYVGGDFSGIGGMFRNRLAAFDAVTGQINSWNPAANFLNGTINAIAVSGNNVYIGGAFTNFNGQTRNRIVMVDGSTGAIASWNPNANGTVNTIAVGSSVVYVGGEFTSIGGLTRNRLAAIDASTGSATTWNPGASSPVWTLDLSGNTVYAGGDFTSIGGQGRNRIAAIDATTGQATSWNPGASSTVRTLALSGNTVYAGGDFTSIGGQTRNYLAAIDATTGQATSWNPTSNDVFYNLTVSNNTVYVGGRFSEIGGKPWNNFAAVSASVSCTTPPTPTITAGGPTTFCNGGSVTLSAPAGFNYLWSNNATTQSITVNTGGSYTVQTISGTCTSAVSAATVVTVNNAPSTPTITAGGPTTFCNGGSVTLSAPAGFNYLWSNNETTQSITVNTGGSYTVQTISGTCTSAVSAATVVTVNNAPSTPTITAGGPTTFCSGGSVTLTAPSGFNYLWSNNATTQSITVNTGGSYTVQTISGTCTSAVSAATVVTVNNAPSTPTITAGGPTTFCSGGSVTLSAPAGFNYLWSNNETTQSITVNTAGSYTVRTIDNGCTSSISAATVVTVNTCGSTWVGGNSTDWNNPSNWSNNQVPGATTDITVPAGTANSLNLTGSFMCRDITLAQGAFINLGGNALMVKGNADLSGTINGNGGIISLNGNTAQTLIGNNANVYRLEVANPQGCTFTGSINITDGLYLKQGVINNNNGTFTLKSNPSGTAFLDNFSSGFTGSLTAGIKFERYSTGAFRHIGAPLAGQTISALGVSCVLVRTFSEPLNTWLPITSNCELEEFDNLGGISFNAGSGANNPTTVTFNGFPVSGTVSFPIVRSNSVGGGPQTGWNSLYNPYASPIDWSVVRNLGSNGSITNRAVWIWNSNINNWATLTGLGVAANGASNIIAAGQGILVRRLTNGFTGNNFIFNNTCRLGLNTNHFIRSGNTSNSETIRFTLSNETQKDETVIHLTELSSQELDENDAERPQSLGSSIELSTLSKSGERLMVNATSAAGLKEIPLSIETPKAGTYTLNLTENLSNLTVQILDLKTGKLTQAENGLTITASGKEEIANRYKLIFNDKKSDAASSFTAWAINATDIQIASVNNNMANLEIFNALGQKMDFTSQANGEGQSVIKLNNPIAGVIFIRLGNTTERVVMGR